MKHDSEPNVDPFEEARDATLRLPPNESNLLDVSFDNSALKRRALTGATATFASQALKFLFKFGSALVLGRLLGPAQFGLIAMVSPIIGFVATLNELGFAQAIVQRSDIRPRQISALFWISTATSAVLASVVMLGAPLVGLLYHEPRTVGITLVLGAMIAVSTLAMIPNALLSRQMRFTTQASLDVATVTVNALASIAAAYAGFGYWSLLIGQVAATLVGLSSTWLVVGWWPGSPSSIRGSGVRPLLSLGVNLTGVNIATYFSMMADNMIVGAVGGKIALGLYDRSYTLVVQPLAQLMSPVGRVALPLLSRLEDPDRYRDAYLNMLRLTVLLTAPSMICCCLIPSHVMQLLLGAKWTAAAPIFGWICFGGIVAPVFGATGWLFTSQGRTHEQMKLSIATALLSIAAFAIGIFWGAWGVALVSALSFTFLQTPLMVWRVGRVGPVSTNAIIRVLASLGVAGSVVAAVVVGLRILAPPFLVFIAGFMSYALFAGLAWLLPGGRAFYSSLRRLRR